MPISSLAVKRQIFAEQYPWNLDGQLLLHSLHTFWSLWAFFFRLSTTWFQYSYRNACYLPLANSVHCLASQNPKHKSTLPLGSRIIPHPFNPPSPPYPSQIPNWWEMVGGISTALVSVEHATSLRPRSICHLSLECSAVCILQGLRSSSTRNSLTHQP